MHKLVERGERAQKDAGQWMKDVQARFRLERPPIQQVGQRVSRSKRHDTSNWRHARRCAGKRTAATLCHE